MPTYLTQTNRTGGIEIRSAQVALTGGMTHISLQLTSTNWGTAGAGTVTWGMKYSVDGGTTWILAGGGIATIGVFNRGSTLPSIGVARLNFMPGALWLLYILPSININLGVTGTLEAWPTLS